MKLYSRGQLIKIVVFVFVITVLLTSSFFLACSKKNKTSLANQNEQQPSSKEEKDINDILQTNDSLSEINVSLFNNELSNYSQEEVQNISVYEMCNEAVVNITTKVMNYNWFLEPYVQDGGSGSGSIIDKRGYILTNVHVIQGATKIYVSLYDGSQFEAEIVGTDLDSDLAVIKFDLKIKN